MVFNDSIKIQICLKPFINIYTQISYSLDLMIFNLSKTLKKQYIFPYLLLGHRISFLKSQKCNYYCRSRFS